MAALLAWPWGFVFSSPELACRVSLLRPEVSASVSPLATPGVFDLMPDGAVALGVHAALPDFDESDDDLDGSTLIAVDGGFTPAAFVPGARPSSCRPATGLSLSPCCVGRHPGCLRC